MTSEDEMVQIGFRGTVAFRHRLQSAALARKMKVQALLEEVVEKHVFRDSENVESLGAALPTVTSEELVVAQHFLEWMRMARADKDGSAHPIYEMMMKFISIDPNTLAPLKRGK